MQNILCIAGPTASGKTALSIALAREVDGEIVSCDSMQIYKGMDIGTAKPTEAEKKDIPHHMLDVAEPWEDFSVSRYCAMATPIVEDILARGKTAIIAGGTGLYMDALIRGNSFAPCPSTGVRQELEKRADTEGMEKMQALLAAIDPEAAERIHDRKRLIRALEVYYETGETITAHNKRTQSLPPRFDPLWLGLDYASRQTLYSRIDLRAEKMVEMGLLEEIRQLLDRSIPENATALQAIGYKEFLPVLTQNASLEEAVQQVQQASRRYAKRQLTWFRRNKAIHWLRMENGTEFPEIFAQARQVLQENDNP